MGANIYSDAAAVIGDRGWGQGQSQIAGGRVCVLGALGVVTERCAYAGYHMTRQAATIAATIRSLGWDLDPDASDATAQVYLWNDEPDRTVEDVLLVLKHAATDAEQWQLADPTEQGPFDA